MAVVGQVNMELHLERESPLKPVQLLIPCGTRTASCPLSCPVQCSPLAGPETNVNELGEQKVNCSSERSEGEDEEHVVDVFISGT